MVPGGEGDRGVGEGRTEDSGGIVVLGSATFALKSKMVASASTSFVSGSNRDVVSMIVAFGSNWVRFSAGIGVLPEELSPANGVPMPGGPGFLGMGFLSDRVESLMLSFQKLPGARGRGTPSDTLPNDHTPTPHKIIYLETSTKLLDHVGRSSPGTGFSGGPTCSDVMLLWGGLVTEGPWKRGSLAPLKETADAIPAVCERTT
jgi:hypothetical protein